MAGTLDIILTVVVLSFWFLFPIGMFISVSHVDKNTDQVIRLDKLRHRADADPKFERGRKVQEYRPAPFDWHHPFAYFREWLQH